MKLKQTASFAAILAFMLCFASGCGQAPAPETSTTSQTSLSDNHETLPEEALPPTPVESAISPAKSVLDDETTNYVVDLNAGETLVIEGLIHEITSTPSNPRKKAEDLFALFPRLETDDKRKVALAALRQVGDVDYDLIQLHLLDSTLDRLVLNTFMSDMIKRKSSIKLPTLLELARVDGHPLQQESGAMLRTIMKTDQGTNWTRWERVVEMHLAGEAK